MMKINLIASCLHIGLIIGPSIAIPVSLFLQPIPVNQHYRPHMCYNPWMPINSQMMVPMMTGMFHPVPRTYVMSFIKGNRTSDNPKTTATTEPFPSCANPDFIVLNSTEPSFLEKETTENISQVPQQVSESELIKINAEKANLSGVEMKSSTSDSKNLSVTELPLVILKGDSSSSKLEENIASKVPEDQNNLLTPENSTPSLSDFDNELAKNKADLLAREGLSEIISNQI